MYKRLKITRRQWLILAGVILIVIIVAVVQLRRVPTPSLNSLGFSMQSGGELNLLTGKSGLPTSASTDGEGFREVLENGRFRLWLHPPSGQIAVEEIATGLRWRSNPSLEELEGEAAKGLLLSNLKSTFMFEYTVEGKTQREIANSSDEQLDIDYKLEADTLQVSYTFAKLGIGIVIQYRLNESGLVASVPTEGITETGNRRIFSLSLLPFFGAARQSAGDGYIFVPDGPGGLIYFNRNLTISEARTYSQPVYGFETANRYSSESRRDIIGYPVFGIKNDEQAFVSIIASGEMTAGIMALPAGEVSGFHSVHAQFIYRQEYSQRLSRLAPPVLMVQKERIRQDREIEYRLLGGNEADYVGMANAYRDFLLETGQLDKPLQSAEQMPLELAFVGGDARPTTFGRTFVPVTTFDQAQEIIGKLQSEGIRNMRITYTDWLESGNLKTNTSFEVEPALGGLGGLKKLADSLKQWGIGTFRLEADLVWMNNSRTGALARAEGIRSVDGTLYNNNFGQFILNPVYGVREALSWWEKMDELGVTGIHFNQMGRQIFRDYDTSEPLEREDTASLYTGLFNHLKRQSADVSARQVNAYTLSGIEHITNLPIGSSYDFIVDETVPFFPIVLHGYRTYSGKPGNLRDMHRDELLKAIEYGAIPYFLLTYEPPRKLANTDTYIFSGEFRIWEERIKEEMAMFQQLAPVFHQRIIGHRRDREGVYITTYEDNTEVEVDYGSGTFAVRGGNAN
ncbi:DUF5696 domain-containing protein [Paenibacillus agaridevorans]|uniref:DUF5696 domain-containing protein n=1 Tax=Paenibacillus agaridevorans TaxID=171404 RepID=UPI001BE42A7E|nr:DUF5696 domain-containing protein [Paenibacillus agaridevorans]